MSKVMRHPSKELEEEARAFDKQILERVANGHIPDLRRTQRCEWFYNNLWRDPVYTDLVFGETVRQILSLSESPLRILEVGCGPGHTSLELARNGHDVVGIDISGEALKVACQTAEVDPWKAGRGSLCYQQTSLEDFHEDNVFDLIVFVGALHHFQELPTVLAKVDVLLGNGGRLFVSEPSRRNISQKEVLLLYLIQTLLAAGGMYFGENGIDDKTLVPAERLQTLSQELGYKDAEGNSFQSPHDNEADFEDIEKAVRQQFEIIEVHNDYSLIDRLVGGLRSEDAQKEHLLAHWLKKMDSLLLSANVIEPRWRHLVAERKTKR